jgi:L-threonylcarbamoyladenylate synthase
MKTVRIDPLSPDPSVLEEAAEIIRSGGLVAFPTETVYGLGGNALDPEAVQRIFAAKGRPSYNPLIAHVADAAGARALASRWPEEAELLATRFWPGPLTLVVPKRDTVPDIATAGLATVALRVPDHAIARGLIAAAGVPIAAPSANRFTRLSPTTAEHVAKGLGDRVQMILDGGPTRVGIESTVLDLSGGRPTLLRPGTLAQREIEEVIGPVVRGSAVAGEAARPAPGMIERHYAPRAELRIVEARGVGRTIAAPAARAGTPPARVGAILIAGEAPEADVIRRLPADPEGYARELYATLHELDDLGCELVLVEAAPEDVHWAGVRDRLRRASHRG